MSMRDSQPSGASTSRSRAARQSARPWSHFESTGVAVGMVVGVLVVGVEGGVSCALMWRACRKAQAASRIARQPADGPADFLSPYKRHVMAGISSSGAFFPALSTSLHLDRKSTRLNSSHLGI